MSQGYTNQTWLTLPLAVIQGGTGVTTSTGTGSVVLSTSPTLVTPTLGAATATSLTFSPSTDGIVGTITNDNAGAGYVGQFITSNVLAGSAISLTTVTATNVTSISLTAGDWDVYGNILFIPSNNTPSVFCWTSTSSATVPDGSLLSAISGTAGGALGSTAIVAPFLRVSVASTTTVYLTAYAQITTGTCTACGAISARRAR